MKARDFEDDPGTLGRWDNVCWKRAPCAVHKNTCTTRSGITPLKFTLHLCHHIFASMTSTLFIADSKVSTPAPCIDLCPRDSELEDGTELKALYGRRTKQQEWKPSKIFKKLRTESKIGSSKEMEESSLSSNYSATSSKLSSAADLRNGDNHLATLMAKASEWEKSLDHIYNEEEVITIMNILSYHDNVFRGFGHLNDQGLYRDECRMDRSGKLFEEAMHGLELHIAVQKHSLLRKRASNDSRIGMERLKKAK